MFSLEALDIIAMRNYASAAAVFECLKPVRGYQETQRHLSRNKDLLLERQGDKYIATYRGNRVVTYNPDGTIVLDHCGWRTPSTATFISRVCGLYCFLHRNELYLNLHGHYLVGRNTIVSDDRCSVLNPVQQERRVLDPDKAAPVRRELDALVADLQPIVAAITPSKGMIAAYYNAYRELVGQVSRTTTQDALQSPERMHAFVLWNATINMTLNETEPKAAFNGAVQCLRRALYKREQCFKYVPVPLGELPKPDRF